MYVELTYVEQGKWVTVSVRMLSELGKGGCGKISRKKLLQSSQTASRTLKLGQTARIYDYARKTLPLGEGC